MLHRYVAGPKSSGFNSSSKSTSTSIFGDGSDGGGVGRLDSGRYLSNSSKEESKSRSREPGDPGEFVKLGVGMWHSIMLSVDAS